MAMLKYTHIGVNARTTDHSRRTSQQKSIQERRCSVRCLWWASAVACLVMTQITSDMILRTASTESSSSSLSTPTKKQRRRVDGSPIIPRDPNASTKTVWLIRHGQSKGQVTKHNRRTDPNLRDCGLTALGIEQAQHIPELGPDLVISSPLTRALHTALLGFPHDDILLHYDLREIGSRVPENTPRDTEAVLDDLRESIVIQDDKPRTVDTESLKPDQWPRDVSPNVVKRERTKRVLRWLYYDRTETKIAIVCHFNVIRSLLSSSSVRPVNAQPIPCTLYSNGDLEVVAE